MNAHHHEYAEIGLTTDVLGASSHRLIQLLMDKCLQQIELAKMHMKANNIIQKCAAISQAMNIVSYLRVCLKKDNKNTMELVSTLDALYFFLETKLLDANRKNNLEYLDQAATVLATVKTGWDGMNE